MTEGTGVAPVYRGLLFVLNEDSYDNVYEDIWYYGTRREKKLYKVVHFKPCHPDTACVLAKAGVDLYKWRQQKLGRPVGEWVDVSSPTYAKLWDGVWSYHLEKVAEKEYKNLASGMVHHLTHGAIERGTAAYCILTVEE